MNAAALQFHFHDRSKALAIQNVHDNVEKLGPCVAAAILQEINAIPDERGGSVIIKVKRSVSSFESRLSISVESSGGLAEPPAT